MEEKKTKKIGLKAVILIIMFCIIATVGLATGVYYLGGKGEKADSSKSSAKLDEKEKEKKDEEDEETSSSKSKSAEQEIYEKAEEVIKEASSKMGQQEKNMYNATVRKYVGNSVKGSIVKIMIEDIITQNLQNVGEEGKFISIHQEGIEDFDDDELEEACEVANIYENNKAENSKDNIDGATKAYRELRKEIKSTENYEVVETMKDGIIYAVTIKANDK